MCWLLRQALTSSLTPEELLEKVNSYPTMRVAGEGIEGNARNAQRTYEEQFLSPKTVQRMRAAIAGGADRDAKVEIEDKLAGKTEEELQPLLQELEEPEDPMGRNKAVELAWEKDQLLRSLRGKSEAQRGLASRFLEGKQGPELAAALKYLRSMISQEDPGLPPS